MQSALYAIARPSVCLSVCPSVIWVDQSKTVEIRIMQLSLLVFLRYKFNPEILTGTPRAEASNKGRAGKQAIF